jgi:hypothetical protein
MTSDEYREVEPRSADDLPDAAVAVIDAGDIIKAYLVSNGFDGLAGDECGCGIDGLFPCDYVTPDCQPAYHHTADACKREFCDMRSECAGYGCYRTVKQEEVTR